MTSGVMSLCLLVCLTASLGLVESHDPQKRLLMTGTENLQQQYHSLQLEIQEMKTKYGQQESTMTQLEETIHDLNNKAQVQENKSQSQESTIQSLRNTILSQGNKTQTQERTINQLSDQISKMAKESGSLYIRWGKKICSSNATLVYSGYTAGTYSEEKGSSASSLCLPRDPIWSSKEPPHGDAYIAKLYGSEYEFNTVSQHIYNNNVPCAVCMSRPHSEVLMLPGRNRCYDDWNVEYSGYLVGPYKGTGSEDFLCMDGHPDVIFGGVDNEDGRLFYFVVAHCGSLQCPPYVNGKVITCVVCSK